MTVRLVAVAVLAHPDGDSYLLGGTLLLHQGRVEPTYLFATSGEAGPIAPGPAATRGILGAVRFGPDGLTSHHDHVRAGEAVPEAFRRARAAEGEPQDAYLRLYQAAHPRSDVDRFYAGVRQGGFGYGAEAGR